jgi:hypothetical protein
VAPPSDAAAPEPEPDATPCERQCMDICCAKDEACAHGRLDDETIPKCVKPR